MTRPLGLTITLHALTHKYNRAIMSSTIKLKIGEFSKLMQITVKTLRHYEQLGLLLPHEVDVSTGYRYYSLEQIQRLNGILHLKNLGFSLEEIKDIYDDSTHLPSIARLHEKMEECEQQINLLTHRLQQLHNLSDSRKKINKMEKFSIQSLPAIIVASHRTIIKSYNELGPLCVNVIGPEMHRLKCKCPVEGYCFTIEHNKEYTPTDIDIEYCEQVEEAGKDSAIIKFKHIPEVPTAICMKHYGRYERFYQSYIELFEFIEKNNYKIIGAPRACYIDGCWNQEDPDKWLSIIQVPVEKI